MTLDLLHTASHWALVFAGASLVLFSLLLFFHLTRGVLATGGLVNTERFRAVEAGVAAGLCVLFFNAIASAFQHVARTISQDDVAASATVYAMVLVLVGAFLKVRGFSFRKDFGMHTEGLRMIPQGLLLLVAFLPLAIGTNLLVQHFLLSPNEVRPQEIVEFVTQAVKTENKKAIWITVLMAIVVAPVAEEFLFRGFIYGACKRFCGVLPALMFTSALFGAVHTNKAALLPLFMLAIVLNVAYERTGSLLVPIVMHMGFNSIMILGILQSGGAFT